MNENLKKFLEYASQNEDVRQKVDALKDETVKDAVVARTIEIAREAGFALSAADFEQETGELSDDELDAVAGGADCLCAVYGLGKSSQYPFTYEKKCQCIVGGWGYSIDNETKKRSVRCACPAAGAGA